MKIGEIIRKYRKEKKMTQEEVASCLGVTAPAVNKWENGNSFPDITLLAPIARLFGISTDILLSYKEDLTDQEVNRILTELSNKMKQEGFDKAFQWAEEKIREYPNCILLIFRLAQAIEAYRIIYGIVKDEKYDETIRSYYERSLESTDHEIKQTAAISLFQFYMTRESYDRAEQYLKYIPARGIHPMQLRANLYVNQEKYEEAYPLYEEILFTGFTEMLGALNGILSLAMKEKDIPKAERIVEKQKQLAVILEMGEYYKVSPGLDLAVQMQDKEAILRILEETVQSMHHLDAFRHSELYSHMTFSSVEAREIAVMLQRRLENDESIECIREDDRYAEIVRELKKMGDHAC